MVHRMAKIGHDLTTKQQNTKLQGLASFMELYFFHHCIFVCRCRLWGRTESDTTEAT